MAKKYDELPVEEWNVKHFHTYIAELHEEKLGVSYQPGGGWQREAGLIGTVVGTQKKAGQYDKALIKEFVTRCINEYKPRQGFPGISFIFMWTYRKNTLQQVELEFKRKNAEDVAVDIDYNEAEEWL